MTVKRLFIQTCLIILILHFTHTYVLLTANLDDFRSIAKKLIPDKLADQLTDMASHSMKYRQKADMDKSGQSEYEDDENNADVREKEVRSSGERTKKTRTTPNKRFAIKDQAQSIDFDELVQKVRHQIENENKNKLQEKRKENDLYKYKKDYVKDDFNYFYDDSVHESPHIKEKNPKLVKYNNKKKVQEKLKEDYYDDKEDYAKENSNTYYNDAKYNENTNKNKLYTPDDVTESSQKNIQYDDDVKETDIVENDEIFKAADLTKTNDSYEDYVTPKRDDVFESDGETTTKVERNNKRVPSEESSYKEKQIKASEESSYREKKIKAIAFAENEKNFEYDENQNDERISEEVKAKTGSLNYQKGVGNQKKLKGTMIPTREFFKMSSPNYYAKLPAVAEKYDFDEPLPERDREPENLTYFGHPPASINKKVKLLNV